MLAGLSVTSFFSILAAFGLAQSNQPASTAVAPATAPAATAPAATSPATAPAASTATPAKSAPAQTVKPVTRSHGS